MNRLVRILVLGLSLILLGGITVYLASHQSATRQAVSQHAVYYCPMHPSYTSNRPGNCPICNMTLVKRETQGKPQQAHDICYMHNCPKAHDGQPCPMMVVAKAGEKVICPICGTHVAEAAVSSAPSAERRILYWTDPMIPGFKSDKPGKSPMGMDLVAVYDEARGANLPSYASAPSGYASILLTPEKQQLVGVKTAPAKIQALTKTIRTVGTIAHDPELYQAEQELIQAQLAWQQAQANQTPEVAEQAQQLVESSRFHLRHLGLSEEMINEIGTWTKPDHRLLLGGAGQYWIYASIYEYELSYVHADQAVWVDVSAFPGQAFSGTVKAIDPMLDPATRTARARIIVEDPQGVLKPGMYVNVSIAVTIGKVLAVPEEAVFRTGEQQILFVDKGQGLFEPRQVVLGAKADGLIEVKSGVAEGEPVVTSGNFLIDSESRLKGALQGAGSETHQHGQ